MIKPSSNCITAPTSISVSLSTMTFTRPVLIGLSRVKEQINAFFQPTENMVEEYELYSVFNSTKSVDIAMMANIEKINQFAEFEIDWDGDNADPFTTKQIEYYTHIIKQLNKQPDISPTAANGIVLRYTAKNGNIQYYNLTLSKTESVFLPGGDLTKAEEHIYSKMVDPITIINNDMEKVYGSR